MAAPYFLCLTLGCFFNACVMFDNYGPASTNSSYQYLNKPAYKAKDTARTYVSGALVNTAAGGYFPGESMYYGRAMAYRTWMSEFFSFSLGGSLFAGNYQADNFLTSANSNFYGGSVFGELSTVINFPEGSLSLIGLNWHINWEGGPFATFREDMNRRGIIDMNPLPYFNTLNFPSYFSFTGFDDAQFHGFTVLGSNFLRDEVYQYVGIGGSIEYKRYFFQSMLTSNIGNRNQRQIGNIVQIGLGYSF